MTVPGTMMETAGLPKVTAVTQTTVVKEQAAVGHSGSK